jgi:putative transposase
VSEYIHKSHNVSVLLYHIVCPTKYRRILFNAEIDEYLRDICIGISERYEITFIEIGVDKDHVHFLVQSIPMYSPTKLVKMIKSITARKMFTNKPQVKEQLWGGEFWSKGYYIDTVGKHASEDVIAKYVKDQGRDKEYTQLHSQQLKLFDTP